MGQQAPKPLLVPPPPSPRMQLTPEEAAELRQRLQQSATDVWTRMPAPVRAGLGFVGFPGPYEFMDPKADKATAVGESAGLLAGTTLATKFGAALGALAPKSMALWRHITPQMSAAEQAVRKLQYPQGFYSKLDRAALQLQRDVPIAKLQDTLAGAGVNGLELQWRGVPNLIKRAQEAGLQTISREELLQHLADNPIDVRRVVNGMRMDARGRTAEPSLSAVRMPELTGVGQQPQNTGGLFGVTWSISQNTGIPHALADRETRFIINPRNKNDEPWHHPHWTNDPNVVAHSRVATVKSTDGRVANVAQEFQSDMEQEALKHGRRFTADDWKSYGIDPKLTDEIVAASAQRTAAVDAAMKEHAQNIPAYQALAVHLEREAERVARSRPHDVDIARELRQYASRLNAFIHEYHPLGPDAGELLELLDAWIPSLLDNMHQRGITPEVNLAGVSKRLRHLPMPARAEAARLSDVLAAKVQALDPETINKIAASRGLTLEHTTPGYQGTELMNALGMLPPETPFSNDWSKLLARDTIYQTARMGMPRHRQGEVQQPYATPTSVILPGHELQAARYGSPGVRWSRTTSPEPGTQVTVAPQVMFGSHGNPLQTRGYSYNFQHPLSSTPEEIASRSMTGFGIKNPRVAQYLQLDPKKLAKRIAASPEEGRWFPRVEGMKYNYEQRYPNEIRAIASREAGIPTPPTSEPFVSNVLDPQRVVSSEEPALRFRTQTPHFTLTLTPADRRRILKQGFPILGLGAAAVASQKR